jgi:hypothetical protein
MAKCKAKYNGRLLIVAENDFLHPIEANFGGLNSGGSKVLNTLIYVFLREYIAPTLPLTHCLNRIPSLSPRVTHNAGLRPGASVSRREVWATRQLAGDFIAP